MAQLFEIVPSDLFNPLAARGAAVYGEVLLSLFAETQKHHQPLSRELAVAIVTEVLSDPQALELTVDVLAAGAAGEIPLLAEDPAEEDLPQARASAILRYLARCGWLRTETQSDFSQTYILPDYAFRLLRVISEIAAHEAIPLQGLICAIHDLLQAAVRDGNIDIRLPEAHRQTVYLLNGLKELQHNIGLHIEQVLRQLQARDVLNQVFADYREQILDRAYHQLRTTDHVSRFRPGVIEATAQLERSGQIELAAKRLYERGESPGIDLAAIHMLDQMREIREQFESLDRLLQAIDIRHSQFVDSAVRTVELQLAASSTTSGQIHTILTYLLHGASNKAAGASNEAAPGEETDGDSEFSESEFPTRVGPEQEDMAVKGEAFTVEEQLVSLFELGFIDPQSLAPPSRTPVPFTPEIIATPALTPAELESARQATLQQLNRAVSRERVRRFALKLLDGRETVHAAEIPLAGPEDLPLLIYLRSYGDGSLGYSVEENGAEAWIEKDGVGFRDFVVRRD
ncbi:MAG: hypothetical protein HY326_06475 [Chloroflexi bacterium]|nr:hypothetical protein [Chloroflexota bacterium]